MTPETNPIPLDYFFMGALLLITVIGYWRGLGKEILQLTLFLLGTLATFFVFDNAIQIHGVGDVIPTLKFLGLFMVAMFVVTFLLAKVAGNYFFTGQSPSSVSHFLGAVFAVVKLGGILVALNLAFAIANPYADRFRTMPDLVKDSKTLQITDFITEKLYIWLADKKILAYKKYLMKRKTNKEIRQEQLMERLEIKLPPKPW